MTTLLLVAAGSIVVFMGVFIGLGYHFSKQDEKRERTVDPLRSGDSMGGPR